jgi:hypothetical protein
MPLLAIPNLKDDYLRTSSSHFQGSSSLYQTQQNMAPLNLSMMEDKRDNHNQQAQAAYSHVELQRVHEQIRNISEMMRVVQKQADQNENMLRDNT